MQADGGTNGLLAAAEGAMAAGDAAAALDLAARARRGDPLSSRAARVESGILDACGRREEAIRAGEDAAALDPSDAGTAEHLGGLLLAERRWREAASHLDRLGTLPGSTARGWRLLSTALHQLGDGVAGIGAARRSVAMEPNTIEYRLNLAALMAERALFDEALEEIRTAAEQAPDDARVARAASGLHEALGDLAGASREAERACSLAPADLSMSEHRNRVLAAAGATVQSGAGGPPRRTRKPGQPRPPRRPTGRIASAARSGNAISALMLREMRTRFGKSRLGYLWALLEPLGHLLTLGSVFSLLNHSPPPVGDSLFLFYLTGLLPYFTFGHISEQVQGSLDAGAAVLNLPAVRRTDVVASRAALQALTELAVMLLAFGTAAALGEQGMPGDPLGAFSALLALALLGTGVGMINMTIRSFVHSWDQFWSAAVRMLYFTSGIYYSPMAMPDWAREVLEWNPVLQGVEAFRASFFDGYEPHWLDIPYLWAWALGAVALGLLVERASRRRVRVGA